MFVPSRCYFVFKLLPFTIRHNLLHKYIRAMTFLFKFLKLMETSILVKAYQVMYAFEFNTFNT